MVTIAEFQALKKKKRAKYKNIRVIYDGIAFDSKKEGNRYLQLKHLLDAGKIRDLRMQQSFRFEVNGRLIGSYRADFQYYVGLVRVVEDVKSDATRRLPVYRLKKKMMWAFHSIEIQEV